MARLQFGELDVVALTAAFQSKEFPLVLKVPFINSIFLHPAPEYLIEVETPGEPGFALVSVPETDLELVWTMPR